MVTYAPFWACCRMARTPLFWPFSSNFTPVHGMMSWSAGMFVATSALRIASGSVDFARLMASASVMKPVKARAGLEMKLMTPTGAYLESRQEYLARAGSGDRAETTLDATYTLDVTQDGETIAVAAQQRMTESEIELESTVQVGGRERYRRAWRREWRRP